MTTRSPNEGLAQAPLWTPHRKAVTGVDGAAPITPIEAGLDSRGWQEVAAEVKATGGTVICEILYWSDLAAGYVKQEPEQIFTAVAAGQTRVIQFTPGGRRFFIHLTGTFTQADVNVAALAPQPEEQA